MYFRKSKLKRIASQREEKWKNMSREKRLIVAKSEPVQHAFNHHFANSQHFKDPQQKKFQYLTI